MFTDYSKYRASDYLTNEYFIDSMLNPTTESKIYWETLFYDDKINTDEFITAFMMLKRLHENKFEVSDDKIQHLWDRIEKSNFRNELPIKRLKLFRVIAVAASFVGIIGLSLFMYTKSGKTESIQSIADFAKENIIHTQQPNNEIQLISGNHTLAVQGDQAKVEYDEKGKLKVNKQSMAVNQNKKNTKDELVYNQLRVPYGKRAFLTLSDGSTLWINTGTTVIYPVTFAKEKREIFVEGEVYAEVFHDSKRPFFIKTEKLDVRVLGTVFNVTAYKEDRQTNVVLVSGSVNVKPKNGKVTLMKPNQLFAYSDIVSTLKEVDVENYTSWHEGKYIFKNEPIENILLRLSRYYNVTMKLPSSATGITCSGKLELKDDLSQLMNGLTEITSMSFSKKGSEYKVSFE